MCAPICFHMQYDENTHIKELLQNCSDSLTFYSLHPTVADKGK